MAGTPIDVVEAHIPNITCPQAEPGKLNSASIGAIHDWRLGEHTRLGLGALYAVNRVPTALEPAYKEYATKFGQKTLDTSANAK